MTFGEPRWKEFRDPLGEFTLSYPGNWAVGDQVELPEGTAQGASLVAVSPQGDVLLEVYALKAKPLKLYTDLYQEASQRRHLAARVVGTGPYELPSGQRCVRLTLTAIERTVRESQAEFTTDYYVIDAGTRVFSLNFKTLTGRFALHEPTFARIVASLALPA